MAAQRLEVCFSGRVQGVGFRFATVDIADRFPEIAGYVRNLADGRVEVVAEGPEEQLATFITAVEDALGPYIHAMDKNWLSATGEFAGFTIAR